MGAFRKVSAVGVGRARLSPGQTAEVARTSTDGWKFLLEPYKEESYLEMVIGSETINRNGVESRSESTIHDEM